jgi:ribosomal protein L35
MKTIKSLSKRFSISSKGKVMKRKCGQSHLNAKESGKITLNKRRDPSLSENSAKVIRKLLFVKK